MMVNTVNGIDLGGHIMMRKLASCLILILFLTPVVSGEILHVVEGYDPCSPDFSSYDPETTYSHPQRALGDALNGDEILIHAGTYPKIYVFDPANPDVDPTDPNTGGLSHFCMRTDLKGDGMSYAEGETVRDINNVWIHSAGDGRVTLQGIAVITGTPTGNTGNITIEGLYFDVTCDLGTGFNRTGVWLSSHADPLESLQGCKVTDCVIYCMGDYIDNGIYIYGAGTHGQHTFEHNTIYQPKEIVKNTLKGIGIRSRANGPITDPVVRSNIVVNMDEGVYYWYGDYTYDYSNSYGNEDYDYRKGNVIGPGSYSMDPGFVSLDPNDPLFLMLGYDTPDEIMYGAHDGACMGARLEKLGSVGADECAAWGFYGSDVNSDCRVNVVDFAAVASRWMDCTHPDCD